MEQQVLTPGVQDAQKTDLRPPDASETPGPRAKRPPERRSPILDRDKPPGGAGTSGYRVSFSWRNRFRLRRQMVAAAASMRLRTSIFWRTVFTNKPQRCSVDMDRGPSELALLQYMQPVPPHLLGAQLSRALVVMSGKPFTGCDISWNRFFRGVTESQPLRHSLSQWSCNDLLSVVPESCRLPPGCLKLPITARTAFVQVLLSEYGDSFEFVISA